MSCSCHTDARVESCNLCYEAHRFRHNALQHLANMLVDHKDSIKVITFSGERMPLINVELDTGNNTIVLATSDSCYPENIGYAKPNHKKEIWSKFHLMWAKAIVSDNSYDKSDWMFLQGLLEKELQ